MTTHPAYPRAWQNPVDLRPSAALEAAGAWDPTPVVQRVSDATALRLIFSYTPGAAGGAFDWQLQTSYSGAVAGLPTGAAEWIEMSIEDPGAVLPGADTQSHVQAEYQNFEPVGVGQETFEAVFQLDGTAERIRVLARETGVVLTPGTLQLTAIIL